MYKIMAICLMVLSMGSQSQSIRVATFNVSMEATNYLSKEVSPRGNELQAHLLAGNHSQIKNIAEIIQIIRPDIILLNEFDYSNQPSKDIQAFINNYLALPQGQHGKLIQYPYFFSAPVNTGIDSGLDLDGDGTASGIKGDAFGFGLFPGQYGMAILSRFPIEHSQIRTFQKFLWKDMPTNLLSTIKQEDGKPYYNKKAQDILRLSSKSHWDVPINIKGRHIHLLASHPTPPVFDGSENRNGKRNHDEIRFWVDYISGDSQSSYIYDDQSNKGGLKGKHFVIAGDLNASPDEGDSIKSSIISLIQHPDINGSQVPASSGGKQHQPENIHSPKHTATWGMRADYVLPSNSLKIVKSGVFWPEKENNLYQLVKDRSSSSDHRLVWIDLEID